VHVLKDSEIVSWRAQTAVRYDSPRQLASDRVRVLDTRKCRCFGCFALPTTYGSAIAYQAALHPESILVWTDADRKRQT
jgi:hypothetical protein